MQMAMQYGIATLVEYIGDKVVFFDLRENFVARLYYPSPSQCRLSSFLHQVTPYTLLHTLHPTPYTLHPAPCTLHPTPYTLHPTPYTLTLHPTPCTRHPTP